MSVLQNMGLSLVVGTLGGLIGMRFKVTGSVMIGAMIAVILLKVYLNEATSLPKSFLFVVQILVGVMVGATYTPEMSKIFSKIAFPVICSTLVLVFSGLLVSVVLIKTGVLDIATSYFGTSPGGLSALVALAAESGANPTIVAAFHFFRLVFILLTAPLIFHLCKRWL